MPPIVPNIPNVPVVGQDELLSQEQWKRHKLNELLEKQQEELQKQANEPFKRVYYKTLRKGALTYFQYSFWKHDPYPLVLVSSLYTQPPRPGLLAGVNLHYLTFKYIKYLIQMYCGKQFYYNQIKNNLYIYNSFRTYKRTGIRLAKMLDCNYLMNILGAVRSYKPSEIAAIRKFIQEQLRKQVNPTARDLMSKEFSEMISNDPQGRKYIDTGFNLPKDFGPPYSWIPKPTRGHGSKLPETEFPGGTSLP